MKEVLAYYIYIYRFPILALGIQIDVSKIEAIIISTAVILNISRDLNGVVPNRSPELEKLFNLTQFRQRLLVFCSQNNHNHTN